MQKEYLSAAAEVLSDQGVDENLGLSNDEASSRLAKTGPNKLEEAEKTPLWKRFFEQMADPMVIMLIVAAVISALTLSSTRCWAWSRRLKARRPSKPCKR